MSRKRIRQYLPSPESIADNRFIAKLGPRVRDPRLWHWNRRTVARGVAVGMFAGLIPGSNPVQFGAAAAGAIACRVNLPVAVFVTLYSNPFTIVPLYYVAFRIGQFATMDASATMPALDIGLSGRPWTEWAGLLWQWVLSLGKPLAVGLPLLATGLAIAGYFVVDWAWRISIIAAWRRRSRRGRFEA
jgi:uncharacterized protein (DUF2062 family)